ncbi:hypothetical protein Arnit_1333 [Arcobacter nitrofigilis DSM 7299]|uniref:Uncharacterized protein n=1 Tax=Arcobacter nitrofigilis (strain ATCC 33309 / DSM 7299 / CCUG 15893 / LMG 7604 / NCTC 12251 / CI) TaxID=572480 RepID=D5V556_ARCNC|nr:hypothetical protein [Arcobacter nitrofigilis]ADG92991.1 hypothetical protein Arnit_1333 [Arcobacter nitrofigilis DSM 7299]
MEKIVSTRELKKNFLELCNEISNDDSKALLDLKNTEKIEFMLKPYCTEAYPIRKVLILYHRYACVAFISAEFVKNAKVYIDEVLTKYIVLALVNKPDPDEVSVVYSNVDALSKFPTRAISIKDIIEYLESENIEESLREFYKKKQLFF